MPPPIQSVVLFGLEGGGGVANEERRCMYVQLILECFCVVDKKCLVKPVYMTYTSYHGQQRFTSNGYLHTEEAATNTHGYYHVLLIVYVCCILQERNSLPSPFERARQPGGWSHPRQRLAIPPGTVEALQIIKIIFYENPTGRLRFTGLTIFLPRGRESSKQPASLPQIKI